MASRSIAHASLKNMKATFSWRGFQELAIRGGHAIHHEIHLPHHYSKCKRTARGVRREGVRNCGPMDAVRIRPCDAAFPRAFRSRLFGINFYFRLESGKAAAIDLGQDQLADQPIGLRPA